MFCTGMVLPCFDQPDLKSNMNLELITHSEWHAVSNSETILEAPVNRGQQEEDGDGWLLDFFLKDDPSRAQEDMSDF